MQISDKSICRLLLEHNSHGMELMFQYYYRPLVLWADTYLNDIAAAEDLVQDFFLFGKIVVMRESLPITFADIFLFPLKIGH